MAKEEIIITIDNDGTAEFEGFGLKGKGCSKTIKELMNKGGRTKKVKKKAEWYQRNPINVSQKDE